MARRGRARAAGLGGALAVLGLAATACAGIPVDGRVVPVDIPADVEAGEVQVQVGSPPDGASPKQVVQGFLDAMASNRVGVAQEYLAVSIRDTWSRGDIVVYEGDSVKESESVDQGSTNVTFTAESVATIDSQGRYRATPDQPSLDEAIRLVRDEDDGREWRIADPPVPFLISSFDLVNRFGRYDTFFISPSRDAYVVEPVWLPSEPAQLVDLLVQEVVDGPTVALGDGVLETFPPGTAVNSVSVDRDRVGVALSGSFSGVAPALVDLMLVQLDRTLDELLGPVTVQLSVGGRPLNGTGRSLPDLDPLRDLVSPDAYALTDSGVRAIGPDGVLSQVPGPLGRNEVGGDAIAVSLDESLAALVSGGTVNVAPLDAEGPASLAYQGASVARPSWDRTGRLWVVDRQAPGPLSKVMIIDLSGPEPVKTDVPAPDLENQTVVAFRVAPDGVRVAAITSVPEEPDRLRLGHIVVGDDGALSVEMPVVVPLDGSVTDVSWAGPTELLVVLEPPEGLAVPLRLQVDGSDPTDSDLRDVGSVTAFTTRQPLAISSAGNILRLSSVTTWEPVGPGRAVAYPG